MPYIKKILNYSVLLVSDESDEEYIVLQKGIGFGKKAGDEVEILSDGRVFVPVPKPDRSQLLGLLAEIPASYLELTQQIVAYAEETLHTSLNEHIYLALTDHLHFAVERFGKGLIVTNRVF